MRREPRPAPCRTVFARRALKAECKPPTLQCVLFSELARTGPKNKTDSSKGRNMRGKIVAIKRDLWGGALIALCGVLTIMEANTYAVGELARMGPGYFPMLIGGFLIELGLLIPLSPDPEEALESHEDGADGMPRPTRAQRLRGMACIAAGIGAFIVIGHLAGFIPATFALVFISAMGDTSNTWRAAALLATAMAIFGAIVFSWGLQLQFPMFRWS